MLLTENNGLPFTLQCIVKERFRALEMHLLLLPAIQYPVCMYCSINVLQYVWLSYWCPAICVTVLLVSCNMCDCPIGVLQYVWLSYWCPAIRVTVLLILMSCDTCDCPSGVLQYVWLSYWCPAIRVTVILMSDNTCNCPADVIQSIRYTPSTGPLSAWKSMKKKKMLYTQ